MIPTRRLLRGPEPTDFFSILEIFCCWATGAPLPGSFNMYKFRTWYFDILAYELQLVGHKKRLDWELAKDGLRLIFLAYIRVLLCYHEHCMKSFWERGVQIDGMAEFTWQYFGVLWISDSKASWGYTAYTVWGWFGIARKAIFLELLPIDYRAEKGKTKEYQAQRLCFVERTRFWYACPKGSEVFFITSMQLISSITATRIIR